MFPVGNVNEINDMIGKLQLEMFLINQNYDAEESIKEAEKKIWWEILWNNYKSRLILNENIIKKLLKFWD